MSNPPNSDGQQPQQPWQPPQQAQPQQAPPQQAPPQQAPPQQAPPQQAQPQQQPQQPWQPPQQAQPQQAQQPWQQPQPPATPSAYPAAQNGNVASPQATGNGGAPAVPQNPSGPAAYQQPTSANPQQPTSAYAQQPTSAYPQPTSAYPQQPTSAYPQPTSAYPTAAYATTGQSTASAPYPSTQSSPPRKKKRGRVALWISLAAVLVLLAAGGVVGGVLGTQANAPEREVEEYLTALVDGDVEDAFAVAGEDVSDADLLLSDDVYADVEDRISGYEIGETTISGDTAEVAASISQGDESYEMTFTLAKAGKAFVVFDTWKLQAPELGVVSYSVAGPEETAVTVAGVDATTLEPAESGSVELRALPGTYPVALASDDTFFAAEPVTVSVVGFGADAATATTADGSESNVLTVTLTEEAVSTAKAAVDAYVDGCAASTDFRPEGCPFAAHGENPSYDYSNCKWTLDPPPELHDRRVRRRRVGRDDGQLRPGRTELRRARPGLRPDGHVDRRADGRRGRGSDHGLRRGRCDLRALTRERHDGGRSGARRRRLTGAPERITLDRVCASVRRSSCAKTYGGRAASELIHFRGLCSPGSSRTAVSRAGHPHGIPTTPIGRRFRRPGGSS